MANVDLLIVGGGMAAERLVRELDRFGYQGSLMVCSDEASFGYNRVLLPTLLAGDCEADGLQSTCEFPALTLVVRHTGVAQIDLASRSARTRQDETVCFGKLVFATGSTVNRPPVPGNQLPHVMSLRTLDCVTAIRKRLAVCRDVAVIGGGLLGLEAADAIARLGHPVTVIHRGPFLMNRQLDRRAGEQLAAALAKRGISVRTGAVTTGIEASRVLLDEDHPVPADLVLVATGVSARTDLARDAGIGCDERGIAVGDTLATSEPGIYAIGECASVNGTTHQLVAGVHHQAKQLAALLCDKPGMAPAPVAATRLKIPELALFSVGDISPEPGAEDVLVSDTGDGVYRRLAFTGDRLDGALLMGDISGAVAIETMVHRMCDAQERTRLAFGGMGQ